MSEPVKINSGPISRNDAAKASVERALMQMRASAYKNQEGQVEEKKREKEIVEYVEIQRAREERLTKQRAYRWGWLKSGSKEKQLKKERPKKNQPKEVKVVARGVTISTEAMLEWYWTKSNKAGKWLSAETLRKTKGAPASVATFYHRFSSLSNLRRMAETTYGPLVASEPDKEPEEQISLPEEDKVPQTYLEMKIEVTGFEPIEISQLLTPK